MIVGPLKSVTPAIALELFLIFNFGFLAIDIVLAHRLVEGAEWPAWIPLVFSVVAPAALLSSATLRGGLIGRAPRTQRAGSASKRAARAVGVGVGVGSTFVGAAGLVYHLESGFLGEQTLESLVYSAPFSAPLAYSGLGLLTILNRTVPEHRVDWARWVLFLAAGGFLGNFLLALIDHAQNGFFVTSEWVSVFAASLGAAFLFVALRSGATLWERRATAIIVGVNAAVGLVGAWLHAMAIIELPGDLRSSVLYGAPVFAPLLFVDLALLAAIGLWGLSHNDDQFSGRPASVH